MASIRVRCLVAWCDAPRRTERGHVTPRIPPVPLTSEDRHIQAAVDLMGENSGLHLFRTLANSPRLFIKYYPFAGKLVAGDALSDRDREIAVVRAAHRAQCDYELHHHRIIGRRCGLSEAEIAALEGQGHVAWSPGELAIIQAVDQLETHADIDDEVWSGLSAVYAPDQLVELLVLIGTYRMVAGVLNSCRVEIETEP